MDLRLSEILQCGQHGHYIVCCESVTVMAIHQKGAQKCLAALYTASLNYSSKELGSQISVLRVLKQS